MKRYLLLSILSIATIQLSAQSQFFNLNNWKVAKISVHAGMDKDMLGGLHQDYFLSTTRSLPENDYSNLQFDEQHVYSMICENPNIRLEATLMSDMFKNVEWRFAMNAIINRIDAISYYNYNQSFGNSDYLNFNNVTNELSLESVVLKALPVTKRLSINGGVGTNVGYSFGNYLSIYGSTVDYTASRIDYSNVGEVNQQVNSPEYQYFNEYLNLRNGISQRGFLQGGVSYGVLKRLELGLEGRLGLGYRAMHGSPIAFTKLNALSLSAKYSFKEPKNVPFVK